LSQAILEGIAPYLEKSYRPANRCDNTGMEMCGQVVGDWILDFGFRGVGEISMGVVYQTGASQSLWENGVVDRWV
jgi:hypothetical protein